MTSFGEMSDAFFPTLYVPCAVYTRAFMAQVAPYAGFHKWSYQTHCQGVVRTLGQSSPIGKDVVSILYSPDMQNTVYVWCGPLVSILHLGMRTEGGYIRIEW